MLLGIDGRGLPWNDSGPVANAYILHRTGRPVLSTWDRDTLKYEAHKALVRFVFKEFDRSLQSFGINELSSTVADRMKGAQ